MPSELERSEPKARVGRRRSRRGRTGCRRRRCSTEAQSSRTRPHGRLASRRRDSRSPVRPGACSRRSRWSRRASSGVRPPTPSTSIPATSTGAPNGLAGSQAGGPASAVGNGAASAGASPPEPSGTEDSAVASSETLASEALPWGLAASEPSEVSGIVEPTPTSPVALASTMLGAPLPASLAMPAPDSSSSPRSSMPHAAMREWQRARGAK